MSIGPDIKEVFEELGTPYTIRKHSGGVISGEYLDYEVPINATSTFIINYTLDATFSYDTRAKCGDIIEFDDNGSRFLLALANPERFEQEEIVKEARLYRCNVWGHVKRRSVSREAANEPGGYTARSSWDNLIASGEDVLLASNAAYMDREVVEYGLLETEVENLHISGNIAIQEGDRFESPSAGKFEIMNVSKRRLNNVIICRVQKDERE